MNAQSFRKKIGEALGAKSRFTIPEWFFLRALGLVYLTAFASFWPQIVGLIGTSGIVPAAHTMQEMYSQIGTRALYEVPSLFWFDMSDRMLVGLCIAGCVSSLLLALNVLPRLASIACFLLYLSISAIGQPFTSFQWDALLIEAGFLAIFAGAPWLVWAYRLLLFRLMFESGWVKLSSHDPNWRNLHALRFHFLTQPLPNPIAYYVYRAPGWLLDSATALVFVIELGAPLLLFAKGRLPKVGAGAIVLLQVLILLTGNYTFFNWLTIALCLWTFDSSDLERFASWRRRGFELFPGWLARRAMLTAGNLLCAVLIALGGVQLMQALGVPLPALVNKPIAILQPFEVVNSYGLFAVMTTSRTEIVIEGSDDRTNWIEYAFPYKPGNVDRGLPWVAPYQPRLDWQMWFAALGDYQNNTWVGGLMYRLLTGQPQVLALLDRAPFAKPPHFLRALAYQYDFTTPAERRRTGAVWKRRLLGTWFGPVALRTP